jgi:predicted AAA+ superfamily ATPase
MQFQRAILTQLVSWKNAKNRKPLILMGARQVGKTSILKILGETHYENVAYFNFEKNTDIKSFFQETKDVEKIVKNLSLLNGQPILPEKTLVIFDEIQECRDALNTLKYFQEDIPEYHVACAGSLLGITLGQDGSFPVGKVNFLEMYPLTFSEYLRGISPKWFEILESVANNNTINAFPEAFFNPLLDYFRQYFISGGMPEAAKIWSETQNIEEVETVLKEILNSYRLDFSKHANAVMVMRINHIWDSLPSQLARENKKFLYQAIKSGARAREYEEALTWLIQAGIVQKISKISKPGIPLKSYVDLSAFKLYLLDVGLLRVHSGLDYQIFAKGNQVFTEFKGALTENYISQAISNMFAPYYYTSEGIAEIDFLIETNGEILPIEVKSDINIKSKSLTYYSKKFDPKLKIRFSSKNLEYRDGMINIPLFLADYLPTLIKNCI